MPTDEHLVLCDVPEAQGRKSDAAVELNLDGPRKNVNLKISDLNDKLIANVPDVLVDLIEIATYVYAADAAISRGGPIGKRMGERWRRRIRFVIPVSLPDHWSSREVSQALVEALTFLSDDNYAFEFVPRREVADLSPYFDLPLDEGVGFAADEVVLFSGGLDSLSGAIEELAARGRKVALVSHRSSPSIAQSQRLLVEQLREQFGADRVFHVPIWANLNTRLTKEPTHRTRSFLFAALGAATASLLELDRIRFYENGVVSLNLPPVDQVVGSRATRSTHPQALAGFRRLLSAVLGRPFDVENPFAWLTKKDVVERISEHGCAHLIRHSRSCTRVHDMTKQHPHCGHCSQCIDRRFAVLAAGQEPQEPAEAYKVDLFTGERPPGPDRELALSYVRNASDVTRMEDLAFFERHGEISRIVSFFDEPAHEVAKRILDLHQRHADEVCRVFDEGIAAHAPALREGTLPEDSLLTLIVGREPSAPFAPEPAGTQEKPTAPPSVIRLAISERKQSVTVDAWGDIRGATARLIMALAGPFRKAVREEVLPEDHPCMNSEELQAITGTTNDESLRRLIMRCRAQIKGLAKDAGIRDMEMDAVIETIPRHGYRLNPERVRFTDEHRLKGRR